jgi:membrane protease YdiL (CAAX protease family)
MVSRRLLLVALAAEGALALVGLAWSWIRHIPLSGGPPLLSAAAGVGVALLLAALYGWLLSVGPDVAPVQAMRRLYHDLLRPVFGTLDLPSIILISAVAGIGEEILFRGVLQQEFGLVVASLVFGAVHVGGRGMVVLGAWAGATGFVLGGLALATGGLIAPIVAHALYDALALAYIRWGPLPPAGRSTGDGEVVMEAGDGSAGDGRRERASPKETSDPQGPIL